MAVGRPPPTPDGPDGEHRSVTVDALADQLREVVKTGLNTARLPDDGALAEVVRQHARRHGYDDTPDDLARALRDLIHDTLATADADPATTAARAVLGDLPETRIQPAAERRRIAADQFDIATKTFRENYEPKVLHDLATRLYTAHHAPPPDFRTTDPADTPDTPDTATPADPPTPSQDTSHHPDDPSNGDGHGPSNGDGDGDGDGDEAIAAVIALFQDDPDTTEPDTPRTARLVTFPAAREQLAGLARRVPRHRYDLALLVPAAGLFVWYQWGNTAALQYAGLLVIAGLIVLASQIVRARFGTAGTAQALYQRLPRIVLLALIGVVIADLLPSTSNNEDTAGHDPCLGLATDPSCDPADETTTTTTTVADPERTAVTYTEPHDAVPPDCPPESNTDRRVTFADPPPLCIDTTALYVARVETNYGPFDVELNTAAAPYVVNNFVFLARWHFYDGVVLQAPDVNHMIAAEPVIPDQADQAPGYSMQPDQATNYPEHGYYVVFTDAYHPARWAIPVTDDMRQQVETTGYPMLGRIVACEDIILNPTDEVPRPTSAPIVIETITIHQLDPTATTTTNRGRDPHCREAIEDIPGGTIPNPGGTP